MQNKDKRSVGLKRGANKERLRQTVRQRKYIKPTTRKTDSQKIEENLQCKTILMLK